MALFSKKVAVNVEDVMVFRQKVEEFAQNSDISANGMMNILEEMELMVRQRARDIEQIADAYEELYLSIKEIEKNTEQKIAFLKVRLSEIPKEIEKQFTDRDGNEKVKLVENPVYRELQFQIQKENSRLSREKALSWKVYNELSYSRRIANELDSDANELKNIIPELKKKLCDMATRNKNAICTLERCISNINNYMAFTFR